MTGFYVKFLFFFEYKKINTHPPWYPGKKSRTHVVHVRRKLGTINLIMKMIKVKKTIIHKSNNHCQLSSVIHNNCQCLTVLTCRQLRL